MHFFKRYSTQSKANRWNRWRKIFDLLEDRQVVPISEIITATGARNNDIEKDINTLSSRGLVKRTAKGGLTLESFHAEKTLEERSAEDREAKARIARLAAGKYIRDGMTVFIDGSTSVQAMVPFIVEKKLKIITNSLSVIADLRKRRFEGDIICTGGQFRTKANTIIGEHAVKMIREFHADLTILGVEGISSKMELMEAHPAEALTKQAMMEQGDRTIILAMPQKFNDDSLLTFATLKEVEALISTSFPENAFTREARASGVRLEYPGGSQGA